MIEQDHDVDLLDVLYPERVKYKNMGPKDCKFPEEKPLTLIQFSRPTNHDGEQIAVQIPIYACDTLEDMETRFHVLTKLGDIRFRENNRALQKATEIAQENKRKEEAAKVEHQATLKAIKKGILKPEDSTEA